MKIILMMAITLDGKIAKHRDHLADWTSKEDKKAFFRETKKHGVVIMGRTTFDTIGRPLPKRLNLILTSSPERYKEQHQPDLLEFMNATPEEVVTYLEKQGYESAVLAGGARTNAAFLEKGLVDELLITIEPKLFGGGVSLIEGLVLDVDLKLLEMTKLNEDSVQVRYEIKK
jgi:dihydrofolate reductase